MTTRMGSRRGFTLIELLLVLTIIGLTMALIIPRAMRARVDNQFSLIRQYASEIANYTMNWAHDQAQAQRPQSMFTIKDFLYEDVIESDNAGLTSRKLVDKYTGNPDFDGVAALFPSDKMPRNPFNEVDYFAPVNNDTIVPSQKPGLLYLVAQVDPRDDAYLNFYYLFTSTGPNDRGAYWHDGMDDRDPDRIRFGIFVARLYNDQEYGGGERQYPFGRPSKESYFMGGQTGESGE